MGELTGNAVEGTLYWVAPDEFARIRSLAGGQDFEFTLTIAAEQVRTIVFDGDWALGVSLPRGRGR